MFAGDRNRFFVNTSNAGNGALSVTVDGPSKVQLNCVERTDGYEFSYVPMAPGEYMISIKYGDTQHIPGSPYKVSVSRFAQLTFFDQSTFPVMFEPFSRKRHKHTKSRVDSSAHGSQ